MPKIPIDIQIRLGLIKVHNRSPVIHNFWKSVNKQGPIHPIHGQCWVWEGRNLRGYGIFQVKGEYYAHRVSYRIFVEDNLQGLMVLHKCDNPSCVNPQHLFLGTAQDNSDDMVTKGRMPKGDDHYSRLHPEKVARGDRHAWALHPELAARGEVHGMSKLTEDDVLMIRDLYKQVRNYSEVARLINQKVGSKQIQRIIKRLVWKHI